MPWLSREITSLTLKEIDREIASLERQPLCDRSVLDADRLADLYAARRRIVGGRRHVGC